MADDPLHTIETDRYKAVFMLGAEDELESVDDVDAEIILPDRSRWSATFMTLDAIARTLAKWKVTGECLGGIFFQSPDLVIVDRPGVSAMLEVIEGHVTSDEVFVEDTFQRLEPDEGDEDVLD